MYYHPMESTWQLTFNSMLLDQRTDEGQIIKRWMELMQRRATEQPQNAVEPILKFIQGLAQDVQKR